MKRPRRPTIRLLAVASVTCMLALPAGIGEAQQLTSGAVAAGSAASEVYFPPRGEWERRAPETLGMNPRVLAEAIAIASDPANEGVPRDLYPHLRATFSATEPYGEIIGPVRPHGGPAGVIVRHGYIVGEWGDPDRVDMTFSVAKSFLSAVAGLAYDRGLFRSVHDPVGKYVMDGGFDTPNNAKITWDNFLRHASEWRGTLWEIPDWSDRWQAKGATIREPVEPGTLYDYNDVRVNRLALSLLRVFREPLPQVLRKHLMDPIGASSTWEWHGYENSWVLIDGQKMQSVTGGGHWGGGIFISALDQARFGYLTLRDGQWEDQRVLSEEWLQMARTPSAVSPNNGFMNFGLNTGRRAIPSASERAFWHSGHGINRIYVDPDNDLVVVVRWLDGGHFRDFIETVIASIDDRAGG
jgi:CubicO group peptidase (beta-lactamase class C family)